MKKLCIIFASLTMLPAFAHGESKEHTAARNAWNKKAAARTTWILLLTCCPQTSKQIIAQLLQNK